MEMTLRLPLVGKQPVEEEGAELSGTRLRVMHAGFDEEALRAFRVSLEYRGRIDHERSLLLGKLRAASGVRRHVQVLLARITGDFDHEHGLPAVLLHKVDHLPKHVTKVLEDVRDGFGSVRG